MKNTFRLSSLAISIILLFLVCSVPLRAQNQAAAKGSNDSNPPMLGIYWAPGSHPVDTPKTSLQQASGILMPASRVVLM